MIPNWLDSMVIITHILSLDLDWYPTFFKQEDKFDSQNQVRQADIIIENIWGCKIIFNVLLFLSYEYAWQMIGIHTSSIWMQETKII